MRIDLIITELNVGGAERQLTQLAIGLKHSGDKVRVISIDTLPEGSSHGQFVQRLRQAGIEVRSLDCRSSWGLPHAIRRLKQMLCMDRPDVVQTFMFHANVVGTWAASQARVPVRIGGIRVAQPIRWRLWLERQAASRMHAIVCVSRSVEEFARKHLGQSNAAITTIANGVDTTRFAAAAPLDWTQFGLAHDAEVILFVGRLHRQKGIDWLMQAAPRLLAENPSAALVIVGQGPLQSMVDTSLASLSKGRYAQLPPQADIAPLMASSQVLVLPSRYEGMPNVVMEAMAAGLPIVSTDAEGVRELLGEQADRQIVGFADTDGLCDRVAKLLTDRELRPQVIASNRLRAETVFSVTTMIRRYRELYTRLMEESRED